MKKVNALLYILYAQYIALVSFFIILRMELSKWMSPLLSTVFFGLDLTDLDKSGVDLLNVFLYVNFIVLAILTVLCLVLFVINIASVLKDYKNNNIDLLFIKMKKIKFGLIPFWIMLFVSYIIIFSLIYGGIFGLMRELRSFPNLWQIYLFLNYADPFFIIPNKVIRLAGYILLCCSSLFTIPYFIKLKTKNVISKKQVLINMASQFMYITDIISVVYIIKILKKQTLHDKENAAGTQDIARGIIQNMMVYCIFNSIIIHGSFGKNLKERK